MNSTERQQMIEWYGSAYALLTDALKRYPTEMWQFKPAPTEWSIHEVIIHIADSEASSFIRCRKAIAEPGSAITSYKEDVWAIALNYHQQSTDDALELFKWLRLTSYNLIRTLPESAWAQTIEHPENGTMTLDDWLKVYAEHIPLHIEQMNQNYAEWSRHHEHAV